MAKKPSSKAEDIQKKIEIAQKAVSKVTDEALKVVAFQVVLQRLLALEEPTTTDNSEALDASKASQPLKKEKVKQPRGPKGRVEELIEEGFFSQKRTIGDVKVALAAHGWFHRVEDLNPTLLRLIQEKKLRRIKEPESEGGKLIWQYSNW